MELNLLSRSASGASWVGAVALDESEEWLVVAGGHRPTVLHTKSMTPAIVFAEVEQDCFVAKFCNDMVGSAKSYAHETGERKASPQKTARTLPSYPYPGDASLQNLSSSVHIEGT